MTWLAWVAAAGAAEDVVVPSVAFATAEADVVVAGTVLEWSAAPATSDPRPPGTRRLAVTIIDRLKGEDLGAERLAVVGAGDWAPGTPVVVFARYEQVSSSCGPDPATGRVSRSPELRLTWVLAGPPDGWTLADGAFGVVHDAPTLVQLIRDQAPVVDQGGAAYLRAPAGSALARADGLPVSVAFPVDARTEALAVSWVVSPDPALQAAGISGLRRFESTAYIERLLRLAARPGPVGEAARQVLAAWSVALP